MTDLLGAALLSSLPLPLTGLVPWWAAVLYAIPLAWQAWKCRGGAPPSAMSGRTMNVLSLACLALFLLDMLFLSHRLIQVAVHLSLSLIALKAFHLRTARDRAQFALLSFFLAVAGAANSTHPALAVHLLALLALFTSWLLQNTGLPARPARRLASGLTITCLVLSVPLFVLLPRLRGPYVPGGQQRAGEAKSFTLESLELEGAGRSKDDRRIALRIRFSGGTVREESLRLRARTFSEFRNGHWSNPAGRYHLRRFRSDGTLWLGKREGKTQRFLEAFPKDLSPQYLPLPYDAAGLDARLTYAHVGNDGTVRLSAGVAQRQFTYRAFLDADAVPVPESASASDLVLPAGMERDLRDLAERIMPEELEPTAQAEALIRYFAADFRYAVEDYAGAEDPLRQFLFVRKRGHCELYATAGALLLRARGIPARVAVGFMGGERNPLQDYYMVRFSNAHAWVEAWIGETWRVVDPTPPEFRPGLERGTMSGQVSFIWESVSFFWDRHLIGFAFPDQVDIARTIENWSGGAGRPLAALLATLIIAWGIHRFSRRMHPESPPLARYRRLRRGIAKRIGVPETSLSPEGVERAFVTLEPSISSDAVEFFNAYRTASFGKGRYAAGAGDARAYRVLKAALRRWRRRGQRPF